MPTYIDTLAEAKTLIEARIRTATASAELAKVEAEAGGGRSELTTERREARRAFFNAYRHETRLRDDLSVEAEDAADAAIASALESE